MTMTLNPNNVSPEEAQPDPALAAASRWLGRLLQVETSIAPNASPMHRAVDADLRIVRAVSDDKEFALKVWHSDLPDTSDYSAIFAMSQAAADASVAPPALMVAPDANAILFEHLGVGWRTARLDELLDRDRFSRLLRAKRTIHGLGRFPTDRDVFKDITKLRLSVRNAGAWMPHDTAILLSAAENAEQFIRAEGVDLVPAHADGTVSNVMLDEASHIRLVDFDEAGNTDPLFDLAVLVNEVFILNRDRWAAALEEFLGAASASSLVRMRLYAFADDIKWALWGFFLNEASPRRGVEFLKYAEWRWLRARMALNALRREEVLHDV
jgi:thiamine kinase-like enzyme